MAKKKFRNHHKYMQKKEIKKERKPTFTEILMDIELKEIAQYNFELPQYIIENIAYSSLEQAREQTKNIALPKLEKMKRNKQHYIDNRQLAKDFVAPLIDKAVDLFFDEIQIKYPFALIKSVARQMNRNVYDLIDGEDN